MMLHNRTKKQGAVKEKKRQKNNTQKKPRPNPTQPDYRPIEQRPPQAASRRDLTFQPKHFKNKILSAYLHTWTYFKR